MEDEKQPIFVRGAVLGMGPGFKSLGSHLDPEISVETEPRTHGICWLLLLVTGTKVFPSPRCRSAGRGGP